MLPHRSGLRAALSAVALMVPLAGTVEAATVFVQTNYRSSADIPAGFYLGGSPTFLEDFEDGSLDGGITASAGTLSATGDTDSVDGDDGSIDGSGSTGKAWYASGLPGITFTFSQLVTAAGLVWTDGGSTFGGIFAGTTFKAFDGDGLEIFSGTYDFADGSFQGTTAEDTFFGVTHAAGIRSIFISHAPLGMEVDHVQYGQMIPAIPLPAGLPLLLGALGGLALLRWRT